jgi:hypothetical protein
MSISTQGRVTAIGFEASPAMKSRATTKYLCTFGLPAYQQYLIRVRRKKNVHRTFFRSATHATDSTLMGWTANRAATRKLRPGARVLLSKNKNKRIPFAACSKALVA